mgnify:CR=1 FL=1
MKHDLKKIQPEAAAAAVGKAEKYRDLNQPFEAESICRDVLVAVPDHPAALKTLGLALTDQFEGEGKGRYAEAMEIFRRLKSPYEKAFYSGLASERQAKAQLRAGRPLQSCLPLFEQALALYGEAEKLRTEANDDPILRWNSVVRTLRAHPDFDLAARLEPDFDPGGDGPP